MLVQKTLKTSKMKSSQTARDLIEAAIIQDGKITKKSGTYRGAAKVLGYAGHPAALFKMRKGRMRDTEEMKRIILRRQRLARKALLSFDDQPETRHGNIAITRIALKQLTTLTDNLLIEMDK
jgi:hypothetical protein